MPIYEYRCEHCGRAMSKFWRSLSAIDEKTLACPTCGSRKLGRLVSRVRVIRGGGSTADVGPDGDMDESLIREMENVDENDPRALGRLMRKMAASAGEDLGQEFNEVVGRLEKGEDPERIEKEMGDVFGGESMDGMNGIGGLGDEMMPAASAVEAEPTEPKDNASSKRASQRAAPIRKKTQPTRQTMRTPSPKASKKAKH